MLAGNWFGKKRSASKTRKPHRPLGKAPRRKGATLGRDLRVEPLEDRRMLATFVVNNLGDLDADENVVTGSLRQAINLANADDDFDTIVFADFLFTDPETRQTAPQSIFLDPRASGRQLTITQPVEILGPGAQTLSIVGAGVNSRIFETNIGPDDDFFTVTIGGVTLTGGNLTGTAEDDANRGGAILNREILTLIETEVVGNSATWGGGGVYSPIGQVNVTRSLFEGNSSGGGGGAILLGSGDDDVRPLLNVDNSTFTGNVTFTVGVEDPDPGYGGAIFNRGGRANVSFSTFISNSASVGGGGIATNGVDIGDGGADAPAPIPTSLSHNVLFGNSGAGGDNDDVFAVRSIISQDMVLHVAPTLLLDGNGRGYNFIGHIGGTEWMEGAEPGKGTFFQGVSVATDDDADGISWTLANAHANFGQAIRNPIDDPLPPWQGGHLATPATMEENDFITENILDNAALWSVFQPEDVEVEGGDPIPATEESIGPWIGGLLVPDPADPMAPPAWQWITAPEEEFLFTNWFTMVANPMAQFPQPNMGMRPGQDEATEEPFIAYFAENGAQAGTWGDLADEPEGDGETPVGYVLEYDPGTNFFNLDPELLPLGFYGGPTRTYYPNSNPDNPSPLIDAGDESVLGEMDQRGIHFTRVFDGNPNDMDRVAIDIGSVEVQQGSFIVDTLFDESDGQYTAAFGQDGAGINPTYTIRGDFALREALLFSEQNPEFDTIRFSDNLLLLEDPTGTPAPTILLKLTSGDRSALSVLSSVDIIGPTGFELELDAGGNDLTPTINNSDGTRIFVVNDFDATTSQQVSISGLTLLGGDVVGEGGAIENHEDLTLDRLSIKENFASTGGGGISSVDGELMITSSAIFNNTAGFEGGGLKLQESSAGNISSATVRNSTISGNLAARGSGILNDDGELLIEFSTITDNTGPIGAGIANVNSINTFTQIRSSIVSANNGIDVQMLQNPPANVQSLGFNIIGSGNALPVFIQPGDLPGITDPMISPLVFEGGFTPIHRLELDSPAVDAGESTAIAGVGVVPEFDQRGEPFTRVFDGVQDTKDRIDIGAYELQGTTFVVDTPIDEDNGIISLGNLSLREAIDLSNANPLPDVIMFAPSMAGQTIFQSAKNGGLLQPGTPTDIRITDSVTILGLGRNLLTLDGTGAITDVNVIPPLDEPIGKSRFFTIDDGDNSNDLEVSISGFTFTGSTDITQQGASILSHEDLSLSDIVFTANSTLGDGNGGGALYQRDGSLNVNDVVLTANTTDGVDADGGAIYIRDADATILNSVISGNSTTQTLGSGGGLYIRGGTLDMTYSTVSSNLTPGGEADGAGIFGSDSTLNINTSYITGNSMTGSNSEGAGIHSLNSNLTLTDSFVSLNSTTGTQSEGAGLYINGGTALLNRSNISLNTTSGLVSTGSGIAVVNGGDLIVQDTSVERNSTSGSNAHGGGIHNLGGDVTVLDSTISGNTATGVGSRGGGVYTSTSLGSAQKTSILNSTVSGNSSSTSGGGIYNAGGLTEIRHATITNNSVPFFGLGAGVATFGTNASTITNVYSSIIAGNFASSDPGNSDSDVDSLLGAGQNSFVSQGYNVIGTGLSLALDGFNSVGDQTGVTDPMLGLLTFNGGSTFTHAPLEFSPVINAGNPADSPGFGSVPDFDQRGTGFPRQLQGRLDVGAVESAFVGLGASDFDGDGDVDGQDFLAWQRGFGSLSPAQSEGDANLDGTVNSTDLGMWSVAYGTGTAAAASTAVGGSTLAAEISESSEPSAPTAVLSASELSAGVLYESLNEGSALTEMAVDASSIAETVVVRDQLFASLAQRGDYRPPVSADEVADEAGDDDLEVSVEDQVFASLGA